MSFQVRRVVTGHDPEGRAVVDIDEMTTNAINRRPGSTSTVVWATPLPVDNADDRDFGADLVATTLESGVVFRVGRYDPGVTPRRHRTDSIDFAVVLSGEIDMELDDGVVVTLRAGDTLVQRGTIHNWVNNGTEPCIIAFVLLSATPVSVGDQTLEAHG